MHPNNSKGSWKQQAKECIILAVLVLIYFAGLAIFSRPLWEVPYR